MTPLVFTKPEWLAHRFKGVGASEVMRVLDSPYSLWAEKTGRVVRDFSEIEIQLDRGLHEEPFSAKWYKKLQGPIRKKNRRMYEVYQCPMLPCLFATPDAFTLDGRPVEFKSVHAYKGKSYVENGADTAHKVQLMTQMMCCEAKQGQIWVFIGGCKFHLFEYDLNEKLAEIILTKVAEFRRCVETDTPPPTDGTHATLATLAAMHPDDNGTTVMLPELADEKIAEYKALGKRVTELDGERNKVKAWIQSHMGDATFGEGPNGSLVSWTTQEKSKFISLDPSFGSRLEALGIKFEVNGGTKLRVLRVKKLSTGDDSDYE